MKNGDESLFYMFYRVSPATFDVLNSLVQEKLTKGQCPSRKPISSRERLALTLRRCVENVFGSLVSRWRIYERQINLEPENVEAVAEATCVLHNFLSSNAAATFCPPGYKRISKTPLEV
ncbi:hypothetical protein MRX96_004377 [Rhipicephalus microplus]